MQPDERRLIHRLGVLAVALVGLAFALVVSSPLTCPLAPSMDTCRALPLCSASSIHAVDGPSWACGSRLFD